KSSAGCFPGIVHRQKDALGTHHAFSRGGPSLVFEHFEHRPGHRVACGPAMAIERMDDRPDGLQPHGVLTIALRSTLDQLFPNYLGTTRRPVPPLGLSSDR